MNFKVAIRQNATAEVRIHACDFDWGPGPAFGWREGNFACDCNRGMIFASEGGVDTDAMTDEEDAAAFPCGHSAYDVLYVELADGSRAELGGGPQA